MAQPRDSKGRFARKWGGGVVVAAGVAVAVAAGSGTAGTAGLGGGSGAARPNSSSVSKARDRNPLPTVLRLERRGLQVQQRFTSDDGDCEAHSYGLVRDYFADQQCTALFRAAFEVRDVRGNVVLVAVAWVDMPDAASAREFHTLVDGDGTGNITELTREQGPYQDVRFDGERYESYRDGETVVNAQVQPVGAACAELADEAERALR